MTAQEHALQLAQTVRDLGRADSGEVDIQHAVEVMLLNVFLEGLFDIPASSVPGGEGGGRQWPRAVHMPHNRSTHLVRVISTLACLLPG